MEDSCFCFMYPKGKPDLIAGANESIKSLAIRSIKYSLFLEPLTVLCGEYDIVFDICSICINALSHFCESSICKYFGTITNSRFEILI